MALHRTVEEHFQVKIQQKLTDPQPMLQDTAKNVVAAGVSDKCLIQLAYAIGVKTIVYFYKEMEMKERLKK